MNKYYFILDRVSNDTIIELMGFIEKEYKVKLLIRSLIDILNDHECFFILKKDRVSEKKKLKKFTNRQTLSELNFTTEDVINELISLKSNEYLESVNDTNKNFNDEPFRVFIKKIKKIDVYIKIKIRSIENKIIVCVSFHRTQFDFELPYK